LLSCKRLHRARSRVSHLVPASSFLSPLPSSFLSRKLLFSFLLTRNLVPQILKGTRPGRRCCRRCSSHAAV
jgi:hypothetical protein